MAEERLTLDGVEYQKRKRFNSDEAADSFLDKRPVIKEGRDIVDGVLTVWWSEGSEPLIRSVT